VNFHSRIFLFIFFLSIYGVYYTRLVHEHDTVGHKNKLCWCVGETERESIAVNFFCFSVKENAIILGKKIDKNFSNTIHFTFHHTFFMCKVAMSK
jgi:hypothetical protein